ncbi:MAG: GTPase Era [Cytophagaceae bacterium]|nr:GTPase Era [Cytophagaceae bacterium]MDW8455729.1 GTPase Era [Cytophagaceae bacterium]
MSEAHKAGFVNIIGKPNVGKSTLMNTLIGQKLSIITSKAQTTRHRIMGIINGENFQIVYSDTPGILEPAYELHKSMMSFVNVSLEDADIILYLTQVDEKPEDNNVLKRLNNLNNVPVFLLINKIDKASAKQIEDAINMWNQRIKANEIIPISALLAKNTDHLFQLILDYLPEHPPYYPKDDFISDRTERFFASEIIREQIFLHYKKEVPYSCEVVIDEFKEKNNMLYLRSIIYVERDTQKGILIGHKGEAMKKMATDARKELEIFFEKKVFLETIVKVEPDWRNKKSKLSKFGYNT